MSKWVLVMVLGLQAHFAASYLVPLDKQAQGELGGLLRWFWPWSYGDGGPLGQITAGQDLPTTGLFLALTAAALFGLAALAAAGLWIPSTWCPALAAAGAVLLVCLLALFFGPTKLAPMALALGTLYTVLAKPALVGIG
jgi:hypothetical protein